MNMKQLKCLFLIPVILCWMFSTAIAETVPAQSETAVVEVAEETVEPAEAASETTAESAAVEDDETVPDPDFANTQDPLATLRLILAAVGAFAIAFMYSRMQHSRSRARNKK